MLFNFLFRYYLIFIFIIIFNNFSVLILYVHPHCLLSIVVVNFVFRSFVCGLRLTFLNFCGITLPSRFGRLLQMRNFMDSLSRCDLLPFLNPTVAGLCRTDAKHPDKMTLITWKAGKPVVWDVTATSTTAPSYIDSSFFSYLPARQALQPTLQRQGRRPNTVICHLSIRLRNISG